MAKQTNSAQPQKAPLGKRRLARPENPEKQFTATRCGVIWRSGTAGSQKPGHIRRIGIAAGASFSDYGTIRRYSGQNADSVPRALVFHAFLFPTAPRFRKFSPPISQKLIMPLARSSALAITVLTLISASLSAQAQTEPDVGGTNRPLWEAGVAGFGFSGPAYPGASDTVSRGLVLPWIIYRGPVLRADGGSVGARVAKTRDLELDIGFAGALSARSTDVTVRQGMPDLGFLIEFGPRLRYTLARPSSDSLVRLDVPLRGVFELKNGFTYRGLAFEPRLSFDKRAVGAGWGFSANTSLNFGNQEFNEYLYGVPTQFATPTRGAYQAKAGLIAPRVQLTASRKLTDDVRLFAFTRVDFSGSGVNRDSPLHVKDSGTSFGLGLVWTLGRSSEKAVD